ncbi:Voltage-dependent calcium channel subunit alpha-2/delta-4 [Homalodisca vitripennis]|nr:Voltage-dependent calcium channel subunit alpha-2/delta-4 [Homalodisca vitripennis]KAG8317536.1 Voltage-dependent calcium channel subunit alpha-2/delta-4 [Homalodisca vitripennis]
MGIRGFNLIWWEEPSVLSPSKDCLELNTFLAGNALLNYWVELNRLQVNISKTTLIEFCIGNRPNNSLLSIHLGAEPIFSEVVEFLGLIIDCNLSFTMHLEYVCKKVSQGVPLTSFFSGNWKIHPDWVYCDHYITRKNMSPEEKLVYFLKKIYQEKTDTPDGGWKSKLQFPAEEDLQVGNMTYGCNKHKIKRDDYFCDVELMQLLVFDAKSTDSSYKDTVWTPENNIERDLVKKYGVSVRFVATQSGLTRWQHITELPPDQLEFGETNNKAVGEAWYRSAVLQHYINDEDFVFSVPFDSGKVENLTVTASYAIFRRDGGHEAPGSVVGFHLSHSALFDRFREVTSKSNCKDCLAPCSSDTIDCYVIDGNGYIVVSENREETGTFFGVKEGAIMEDMTSKKIFRKIPMFDYQAICFEVTHYNNAADVLLTPFRLLHWLVKSFVSTIAWLIVESNWNHVWAAITERSSEEDVLDYYDPQQTETLDVTTTSLPKIDVRTVKSTRTCRSCDKSGYRYLLQSTDKQADRSYSHEDPCYRPYFVRRIPHTNLLLIVVKALFPTCSKESTTEFKEELYLAEPDPKIPCVKLYLNTLPRRRLAGCYNEHPQPDHKHATSTATRHPYRPPSKSLTFAQKRARPSIIRILSGREFQRRHA